MPDYTNYPICGEFFVNTTIDRIIKSIDTFFKLDSYLVKNGVHEVAISHRIAIYLDEMFSNFNVDCEWNKNLDKDKRLFTRKLIEDIESVIYEWENSKTQIQEDKELLVKLKKVRKLITNDDKPNKVKIADLSGDELLTFPEPDEEGRVIIKNVRPDIVIHHRGTNQNIVVIEVKKNNAGGVTAYEAAKHFDLLKLYALTTQKNIEYQCAVYIEIPEKNLVWKKIRIEKSDFLSLMFGSKASSVFELTFEP